MRILFDRGIPALLRRLFEEHTIDTAAERGWADIENGDLIEKAEQDGYQVSMTTGQNTQHQQNLRDRQLSIVVLLSTSWPRVRERVEEIQRVLAEIRPGELKEISI